MSEERLNDMAILSIEQGLTDSLEYDSIINEFAKENRRIVLN